jgi:protein gp37
MAHRIRHAGRTEYQSVVDDKGNWTGKTSFVESALADLLRRRKPATVGLCFMADAFHESVPDEWLDRMFAAIALTPHMQYILPTKRSARMRKYVESERGHLTVEYKPGSSVSRILPLGNLASMLSASNQVQLDVRAGVWIPPLGGGPKCNLFRPWEEPLPSLDQVIIGGESGPGARACRVSWIESVIEQCQSAGVPCFVKQLGAYPVWAESKSLPISHGRGKNHNPAEWPESLRVQEMPAWLEAQRGK